MSIAAPLFSFDVSVYPALSGAAVAIVVKRWTDFGDGQHAITPLMVMAEIDSCVDLLKAELDAVAEKAKILAQ